MLITLEVDKAKLRLFLDSELFNDTVFDEETRVLIVKETDFDQDDSYLLSMLAQDESEDIRKLIALDKYTPEEVLEELSFDDCDEVREALCKNINISEELLEDLAYDDSQSVRDAASLRIEELGTD